MNGHLSVCCCQGSFSVTGLVDAKHTAVSVKSGGVSTVLKLCLGRCRGCTGRNDAHFVNGLCCVRDVKLLDGGNPAKAFDLHIDALKTAVRGEHTLPGILVISRHVIVGVVSGNDHQRAENHFLIAGRLDLGNGVHTGGSLRLTFHGSDENILKAELIHLGLHLAVAHSRDMRRAVSHKDERCPVFLSRRGAVAAGGLQGLFHDCLCNRFLVRIDNTRVIAYTAQKRLRDADCRKISPDRFDSLHELIVFRPVHQMRGLDHEIPDAVFLSARQRLLYVVDHFAVPGLHMVEDDLGRKRPAHGPVGIGRLDRLLDPADIRRPAVVEGSSKAHDKDLILPDPVRIERVIGRGISCIKAKIVRIFHKFFLLICKGIPCRLRRRDVIIRRLRSLLHVEGFDQG